MKHDRAYHRFKDRISKIRRIRIAKSWRAMGDLLENPRYTGKLVKGKVHCSCYICNGGHKTKTAGPKVSELKKMIYVE